MTSTLDEIQERADAADKEFGGPYDVMPTFLQDRSKLVAALRAVERVCAETDKHPGRLNGIVSTDLIRVLIREALS